MKLLFYIHSLYGGGAERVFSVIVNSLAEKGYVIRVVYTGVEEGNAYSIDDRVEQNRIFPIYRESGQWNRLLLSIKIRLFKYTKIREQAKSFKPDAAISFLTSLNNDVIISLLGLNIPLIVTEHSKFSRYYGIRTNLSRYLFYRFADVITVLTQKDFDKYKNRYPQLVYMPNPCYCQSCKNKYKERQNVILAAGRVNQWRIKGFDTLITCWDTLQEEFPDWECMIAGAYSEKNIEELKECVPSGSIEKVRFLGFRNDVEELMCKSKIFCLTSRVEGFPMVLVEAMKKGCCCVSFDVDNGPCEIIEDGVSGLLIQNQDFTAMVENLRCLMSNEHLAERLAENAPDSVEKYSLNVITGKWENLIKEVVSRG